MQKDGVPFKITMKFDINTWPLGTKMPRHAILLFCILTYITLTTELNNISTSGRYLFEKALKLKTKKSLPFPLSSLVNPHPATVAVVPLKSWALGWGRQAGLSSSVHLSCLTVFRRATSLDFLLHLKCLCYTKQRGCVFICVGFG